MPLAGLIGGLPGHLLGLSRRLSGRVLYALRGLAYLVRDPTERASSALLLVVTLLAAAGQAANGVLRLLCGLACPGPDPLPDRPGRLPGLPPVEPEACHLPPPPPPRCVLRLLGRTLREFRNLLLRALGSLVHLILDTLVLGRLVYGPFKLHIVVGHLLNLGLGIALGELLGVLLELLAVVLDLALQAAQWTARRRPPRSAGSAAGFAAEGSSPGSCCVPLRSLLFVRSGAGRSRPHR